MTCLQGKQAEQRFKHQAKHDAHPLFSGHHIQYPCPAGKSALPLAISSGSVIYSRMQECIRFSFLK